MEHRDELEKLLLSGLPPAERQHVADAMSRTDADKLRHLRGEVDEADATAVVH